MKANPDKTLPIFERELEAFIFKRFNKNNKILKAYYEYIDNLLRKENANMSKQLSNSKAIVAANFESFHKTTAAPQMPDWLKNMSDERREAYFEKNPNSKYNPNRKGSAKKVEEKKSSDKKKDKQTREVNEKTLKQTSEVIKKNEKTAGKIAASTVDKKTQKSAMSAAKTINSGKEPNAKGKSALMKTALVGATAAVVLGGVAAGGMAAGVSPMMVVSMGGPIAMQASDYLVSAIGAAGELATSSFEGLSSVASSAMGEFMEKAASTGDFLKNATGDAYNASMEQANKLMNSAREAGSSAVAAGGAAVSAVRKSISNGVSYINEQVDNVFSSDAPSDIDSGEVRGPSQKNMRGDFTSPGDTEDPMAITRTRVSSNLVAANFESFYKKPVENKTSTKTSHKEEANVKNILKGFLNKHKVRQARNKYAKSVDTAFSNIEREINSVKRLTEWLIAEAKKENVKLDTAKMTAIIRNFDDNLETVVKTNKDITKNVNDAFKDSLKK